METFKIMVEFYAHKTFSVDAENFEEAKDFLARRYGSVTVEQDPYHSMFEFPQIDIKTNTGLMTKISSTADLKFEPRLTPLSL